MKTTLTLAALAASCLAIAAPALAQRGQTDSRYSQSSAEDARFAAAQQRFGNEYVLFQAATDRYRASRAQTRDMRDFRNNPRDNYDDDRDEGNYEPSGYYRDGPRYQERMMGPDERVYRGRDGRYYCKRSDGTTGLIVGAIAGATLGNLVDGGHSRSAGTLIGALAGAVVGNQIDRNSQLRCR
ncbi:glycine zipper 2TM domain-containing protein [Sphingomonas sp. LB-2]|uniref:glycine zipper 2TM domain-containing protein n=1 Tax=Sphingomonas caeni TaxID=2984949 RepID=UPI00223216CB|nr:glycine zipper 2TM domain-containing protein [Sphingomonas caeni]MCW3847728.1 glycine zipper 2TM domain-containing protein [Sphingomonas caeni]